jgi:AcrR family transcriptional regulator
MDRRLTQRGAERRRQIMDVAAHRFAEHGYHPTSVADIVQAIGVGKGVFYWYFASKEALFVEILREAQTDLRRRQQQAIEDEPDPLGRIELGIRASLAWMGENRHLQQLFEFAATEEAFAAALRRGQEVALADTARHLKEAIVEGRIPDADPQVLANAILGVLGRLSRTFVLRRSGDAADVADAAVSFCLGGLLGPDRA